MIQLPQRPQLSPSKLSILLCLFSLIIPFNCTFADEQITFTLNGKSFTPRYTPLDRLYLDQPEILIRIGDLTVLMDPAESYTFVGNLEEDGKLYHIIDNTPHLVGLNIGLAYQENGKRLVNPFENLGIDDMKYVRGIRLDGNTSEIASDLMNHIDSSKAFYKITNHAAVGDEMSLPKIPESVTFLQIQENSSNGIRDYSPLKKLKSLRFLNIDSLNREAFNLENISQNKDLVYLKYYGGELQKTSDFSKLVNLRYLDLGWQSGLTNFGFLKDLKDLRELQIPNTEVKNLRSIENLRQITVVNANNSTLESIPTKSVPSLQNLKILSTKVSDRSIAAFKRNNTQCQLLHNWTDALKTRIQNVTSIRVRSGGTCHRILDKEKTLLEVTKSEQISNFLDNLKISNSNNGFHCMCCGSPSFEFYQGEKLIETIGFHHGQSLRWMDGEWPGDGGLTETSSDFLIHWLAKNGVTGPREEILEAQKWENAKIAKFERATDGWPKKLKNSLERGNFEKVLPKIFNNEEAQIDTLLSMLGASNDSWIESGRIEREAKSTLSTYDENLLQQSVEIALLGNDRQRRRGAARFWVSTPSTFKNWKPHNLGQMHKIVLQVMQQARYHPLRQSAMDYLLKHLEILSEQEIASYLWNALRDPQKGVRKKAIITAGLLNYHSATSHLLMVLSKEPIEIIPLPEVPEGESEYILKSFEDIAGTHDESEVAALALGYLKSTDATNAIKKLAKTPIREIALALLGDIGRLNAKHFDFDESGEELQLAAVECVVRNKGRSGLQWILGSDAPNFWWEKDIVLRKIRNMLLENNALEKEIIREAESLEELENWYNQHGDQYLKNITKT
ncbi:hypothetical protein MLD52_05030 [Puniceicoccaceae bacterium K14]|nr:hypothetical protein [Puniceicoccaceae bacterium K14]